MAKQFLSETTIPVRVAAVAPSGWPVIASLWFVAEDDAIWCATRPTSAIVHHVQSNNHCGFEVAADQPPYRGLRGQARATIHPDRGGEILRTLIDRYLGTQVTPLANWLKSRSEDEVALRLQLVRCQSWDYTARMHHAPT